MGTNTKTLLQVMTFIAIVLVVVILVAKFIISPINLALSDKSTQLQEITTVNAQLTEKLADVKLTIKKELYTNTKKVLKSYILENTSVLTEELATSAADALIDASIKHEVSLSLLVGVAQATSNFNTTYMSDKTHRGILAVFPMRTVAMNIPISTLNVVTVGADIGAKLLKEGIKSNTSANTTLDWYFNAQSYTRAHKLRILESIVDFNCYRTKH